MQYKNPIISGYNPDPSICRVGTDYYIVNSSFEFFPGVPIYHSRNLINWTHKGYCLTEESQLPLKAAKASGGIFAPTIRWNKGTFFMVTTNVSSGGNFIVHTNNMEEGWSQPVWVDQGGIDPSLLFDEDKVYFVSTMSDDQGAGIFLCEVNPFTGEKLTESVCINRGCGGRYPEGPHLYKWFGKYYLMLAEGGTEYGHMETMQRADNPYGPYENCPYNPILSHRDDMEEEIYCTGHADMLEDHKGNWWMVCLGVRTCSNEERRVLMHNLGRETFLAPVSWTKDGWPVVGNDGKIALTMEGSLPDKVYPVNRDFYDDFSGENFKVQYNFLRNPNMENYNICKADRKLILSGTETTLNEPKSPTWIGIRQKDFHIIATVNVSAEHAQGIRAGLTAYYNESYHYEIYVTKQADKFKICLAKHIHDIFVVTASVEVARGENIFLKIEADEVWYRFFYSLDGNQYEELGKGLTVGLCTEGTRTMTFTGTYIGLFAEKGRGIFQDFKVEVVK